MSVIDIIVALFIAISVSIGFFRGISGEIANAIGLVIMLAAYLFALSPLSTWLQETFNMQPAAASLTAVVALMVAIGALTFALSRMLKKVVDWTLSRDLDKSLGAITGLARGAILSYILVFTATLIPHDNLHYNVTQNSWFGRFVVASAPGVIETIKEHTEDNGTEGT